MRRGGRLVPRRWPHEIELLVSAPRWKVAGARRLPSYVSDGAASSKGESAAVGADRGSLRATTASARPSPSQFLADLPLKKTFWADHT
jgi:hypothetical protein